MSSGADAVAAARLLELVNGNWTTQAIGVAAELGLADILADGPVDGATIAARTGCHAESLERLLRGLASLEVCTQEADGTWGLAPMGTMLKRGAHPSMRSWAIYSALHSWAFWGHLLDSVKTGQSARRLLTGREGYAHLEADARAAAVFNRAMEEITHFVAAEVATVGGFEGLREVVDVGGGHGEMLGAVLAAHCRLRGIVFDLPHAAEGGRRLLEGLGLADRARVASGSFFEAIPAGADAYLLKSIVHNWDDERSLAILARCREACPPGGRVMLIERILPARISGTAAERSTLRSDLNMMVGLGGRERTEAHMGELLSEAGFTPRRCVPVGFGFSLLEAA